MLQRGRQRDVGKERFWRDVIRRWQQSGLTVRAFCDAHGHSEVSFHAWRRTITQRDRQADGMPVVDGGRDHLPTFVPVRVRPTFMPTTPSSAPLEVVVGKDRVVRVSPGFDAATLRNLLAVLEEAPSC